MTDAAADVTLRTLAGARYEKGDATRKPLSYLLTYERLLENRRHAPLRILELGVSSGASLLMWQDYLPHATIVGVDIAGMPACLANQPRIHFLQGSQDDPETLDHAARVAGGAFDLIVDDASHIGYLTKRSFNYLFPRWLVPGGYYVIEDIGTGFVGEYPDGLPYAAPPWGDAVPGTTVFQSHQHGMVGMVKQLIDHMMQELATGSRSYLPIQRITVEPNFALIERSHQTGAAVPGPLPDCAGETPPEPLTQRLGRLADEVAHQNARIDEITRTLTRVLELVAPLRFIWRTLTGRRMPKDSG